MSSKRTFVILGASLAGAKAAEALREHGFEGDVVLIRSEPDRPYKRPPLSKQYLRGEVGHDEVFVHGGSFYEDTGSSCEPPRPSSASAIRRLKDAANRRTASSRSAPDDPAAP